MCRESSPIRPSGSAENESSSPGQQLALLGETQEDAAVEDLRWQLGATIHVGPSAYTDPGPLPLDPRTGFYVVNYEDVLNDNYSVWLEFREGSRIRWNKAVWVSEDRSLLSSGHYAAARTLLRYIAHFLNTGASVDVLRGIVNTIPVDVPCIHWPEGWSYWGSSWEEHECVTHYIVNPDTDQALVWAEDSHMEMRSLGELLNYIADPQE